MARRRSSGLADVFGQSYWREAEGRAVVGAWERSGKSVSTFAKEHGVEPHRVSRWAYRLRATSGSVRFHPVRLVAGHRGGERPDAIEVVLVDGRRVRVPEGFAAEDLERVLAVLKGRS